MNTNNTIPSWGALPLLTGLCLSMCTSAGPKADGMPMDSDGAGTATTVKAAPPRNADGDQSSIGIVNSTDAAPTSAPSFDHGMWDALLQAHVSPAGLVDYAAFAQDKRLPTYLARLSAARPTADQPKNEREAFWINAYNAFTIKLIIDHPGVKSIKDIDDPWKKQFFSIGGQAMDLDHIEHIELRKNIGDPRIHFAIVCASYSCPQLWNHAYTAERLDEQLDTAARRFLSDPLRNKITTNAVQISMIFTWFQHDFTRKGTILDFLNRYSSVRIDPAAKVSYLDYDWRLNGK